MIRRGDRPRTPDLADPHAGGRPAASRATPGGLAGVVVALGALLLLAPGCDDLLSTEPDPNTVPADELDNPTSFQARLVGTQADFFFASDMAVAYGGLFADELIDGTGFDDIDERRITADNQTIGAVDEAPEGLDGLWTPMQRAAFTSALLQQDILDGDFPEQVPLDWTFVADVYSTNSQQEEKDLWNMLTDSQRFSVDPAHRDLTIDDTGTEDPRVNAFQDPNDQFAIDGSTELYQLEKYQVATAPVRLASGFEAACYVAEIQGEQDAVDAINDVRAEQGISEEFSSTDEEEIRLKLFDEHARTLFLEGKRMGDLRRHLAAFGLDLLSTGPNFGDQTCMPLPDAERDNNPDI